MISKIPNYPIDQSNQLSRIKDINININNNQNQLKGRIEGDGIFNNFSTNLPQSRPYFNYHHNEFRTKPKNYIEKIIKESDIVQNNNHYSMSLNKARSMGGYLSPFLFSSFSDKKSIPTKLSSQDEYRLKEINESILKTFFGYRPLKESYYQLQQLPSNKELKKSQSCELYSNSLNNYTTGLLELKRGKDNLKEADKTTDEKKTRNTILPFKFPDHNPPTFIKKTFNDKYHTVLNLSSITEYSFRQYHNEKYNLSFDQREIVIDQVSELPYEGIFALFDGHNNDSEIVDYCKEHFPIIFQRQLDYNPHTVNAYINKKTAPIPQKTNRALRTSTETLLVKSFLKLDEGINYTNRPESGCCACVVYITREMEKVSEVSTIRKYIYSANIGDIQCVLLTRNAIRYLSTLHNTDNSMEKKRLRETGGVLYHDKVFGQYQFTRAFGHHKLKSYGITSIPDVKKYLVDDYRDQYVIIGTKGIFNYLNVEDILYFSQSLVKTEDIANKIINHAIMNGSKDNISCFVLKL